MNQLRHAIARPRAARPALGLVLAAAVAAGCAAPRQQAPEPPPAAVPDLPAMRTFPVRAAPPPGRANTEMARDFVDLTMGLENGETLDAFTRFDEPVTVALAGAATPAFAAELDRLLARLRAEARLDIRAARTPAAADITVVGVSRAQMGRAVPTAACFVLPRRVGWDEFRRDMRRRDLSWSRIRRRDAATVFIPADVSRQEVRDCLHEEIAQALGPVNDLYRLEDSIFNDDNMHSVLTGFDMLVLRAAYDPALASGMTREDLEAALPGVLDRLNPAGRDRPVRPYAPSPPAWREAINGALTPDRPIVARRRSALSALDIAQAQGWQDTRLGLSLLTTGRLASGADAALAIEAFLKAGAVYDARPVTAVHAAHVGLQVAALALAAGDFDAARRITERHASAAREARNAALLADLLLVEAAALDALGRAPAAAAARREGFGWARYGLASDAEVVRRAGEIAALVPDAEEGT